MKLKKKKKISYLWIQQLEFFQKPILLLELEKCSLLAQDGYSRPSVGFSILSNQHVTSIGIWEKMEYLGEKMKTHVSKISPGSRAKN